MASAKSSASRQAATRHPRNWSAMRADRVVAMAEAHFGRQFGSKKVAAEALSMLPVAKQHALKKPADPGQPIKPAKKLSARSFEHLKRGGIAPAPSSIKLMEARPAAVQRLATAVTGIPARSKPQALALLAKYGPTDLSKAAGGAIGRGGFRTQKLAVSATKSAAIATTAAPAATKVARAATVALRGATTAARLMPVLSVALPVAMAGVGAVRGYGAGGLAGAAKGALGGLIGRLPASGAHIDARAAERDQAPAMPRAAAMAPASGVSTFQRTYTAGPKAGLTETVVKRAA